MSDDLSGFSLLDLFRSEAEAHLATLSSGLLALEETGSSPTVIEPMMRAAHSLKGAARIVGLDAAVKLSHALEDCFVAVQEGACKLDTKGVDILLRAVDQLNHVSQLEEDQFLAWYMENVSKLDAMISEIRQVASGALFRESKAPPAVEQTPEPFLEPPPTSTLPEPAIEFPQNVSTVEADRKEPASPEPPALPPQPEQVDRVVRVTAESLTRLMSLAGESLVESRQLRPFVDSLRALRVLQNDVVSTLEILRDRPLDHDLVVRARAQMVRCSQALADRMEEFEDFARRSEDLSGRLHTEVLTSRMRPLADGIRGFPRMVRDLSRTLGKQVKFEVDGENTGVDRDILDKLEAPLNHLIRNALDHALERPRERTQVGKPEAGTIRLEARHRAGMLQVTLSDDGRGIDPERLRVKVVERGLATSAMAAKLSDSELFEFLFLPGFSTKEKVTEISGRGVGLDVVQSMARSVGGFARVSSRLGRGTRFTLQLPITMSVIRVLLVEIGGEPYAFPLNRLDRILMLPKSAILMLEGRQHFMMDEQAVGLVEASQVLELPPVEPVGDAVPVVVTSDRSHRFGVVVDAIKGERDLEVRPLDSRLGKVPNVNSAAVLENGWPVLILDVEDLVRSIDNLLGGRRLRRLSESAKRQELRSPRKVLVVDDSITVRELERQLLESQGYKVDIAVDGLDGWNAVRSGSYDLVVSDVDMPRMDGIQFVTLIKHDASLRSIPVVIVSYKDREEDRMRGLDAGANAYLTKSSFHDKTFLSTVVDLIGEASP
jgi:two-component system sensor histidine kinase and response regulator WspE